MPFPVSGNHQAPTSFRSSLKCHDFSGVSQDNIIKIRKIASNIYTYSLPQSLLFSMCHIMPKNIELTRTYVRVYVFECPSSVVNINWTRIGFWLSNVFMDEFSVLETTSDIQKINDKLMNLLCFSYRLEHRCEGVEDLAHRMMGREIRLLVR